MKKIIILFLFLNISGQLFSQNFNFGFQTGVSLNKYYIKELYYNGSTSFLYTKKDFRYYLYEPMIKYNFIGGISIDRTFFKNLISFNLTLNYWNKTTYENEKSENTINTFKYYYLSFPIGIDFRIIKPLYLSLGYIYNLSIFSTINGNYNTHSLMAGFKVNFTKNLSLIAFYSYDITKIKSWRIYDPDDEFYYFQNYNFLISYKIKL